MMKWLGFSFSLSLYFWLVDFSSVVLRISYATFHSIQNHPFHLTTLPQKIIFLDNYTDFFLFETPILQKEQNPTVPAAYNSRTPPVSAGMPNSPPAF